MKEIHIPEQELWDDRNELFVKVPETTLKLENSLKAIRIWESKWKKSYISSTDKTPEEALDYIRCMTLNKVNPIVYLCLTEQNLLDIKAYIDDPMSATTISNIKKNSGSGEKIITAELIYYWMIAQNIPWQFENWHINQLMKLIEVCSIKNDPKPEKMSKKDIFARNRALNAQRKAAMHSKG